MSDETTDTDGGDDFDPSDLSEEVAEKAQSGEEEPYRELADDEDDDDDTEDRRARRVQAKERKPEPKREAKDEEPKKKPEPKKPEPRVYKTKVRGAETDVPAEHVEALAAILNVDPEHLLRGTQMLKAGQESLRNAAEQEKKAKALEERLKKDPSAALREVLGNEGLLKLAIEHINEQMEVERLQKENPAELERRKVQVELDKAKEEKAKIDEERTAKEEEEFTAKVSDKIGKEIRALLDSEKLPKAVYLAKRLASLLHDEISASNIEDFERGDLTAADFLPVLMEEVEEEHRAFYGKMTGEEFIQRHPETADKVRKAYVARAQAKRGGPPERQPEERSERREEARTPVRMSGSDVLRRFKAGKL